MAGVSEFGLDPESGPRSHGLSHPALLPLRVHQALYRWRCSDQICQLWSPELSHPGQVLWMEWLWRLFLGVTVWSIQGSQDWWTKAIVCLWWEKWHQMGLYYKAFMLMVFLDTTVQKRLQSDQGLYFSWPISLYIDKSVLYRASQGGSVLKVCLPV